jgi:type II restriction enzyme
MHSMLHKYEIKKNEIAIIDATGNILKTVSRKLLKESVKEIFDKIVGGKGNFRIIPAEKLMANLNCKHPTVGARDKKDISLDIKDRLTEQRKTQGFSIKSKLGSPATLLNASQNTNFIYEIEGDNFKISDINKMPSIGERLKAIENSKGKIQFKKISGSVFENNLRHIDSGFPEIMAEALLIYYKRDATKIFDVVEKLGAKTELITTTRLNLGHFKSEFKRFLESVAFGMSSSSAWDGGRGDWGGYLIVKTDGEIACLHILYQEEFWNYLFKNTKFEQASRTRHGFGKIYEEKMKRYIKLNLQIRFLK